MVFEVKNIPLQLPHVLFIGEQFLQRKGGIVFFVREAFFQVFKGFLRILEVILGAFSRGFWEGTPYPTKRLKSL